MRLVRYDGRIIVTNYQFVYDDFNDNSFDTSRWSIQAGSSNLQTETGGKLNTICAASASPTVVRSSRNFYDLRKGYLAVRFSRSGTTDANVYTYFGLRDSAGHTFTLYGRSSDANIQTAVNDAGTGTSTFVDTTVGLGPSWTANTYLGWSYTDATKVYSLRKSTDGQTWTEIYKYTVTTAGTFDFTKAGLVLGCISFGTVTSFTSIWDDASYWATDSALKVRVRYGGAWVYASPKVRVSGAWKRAVQNVRFGGEWIRPQ